MEIRQCYFILLNNYTSVERSQNSTPFNGSTMNESAYCMALNRKNDLHIFTNLKTLHLIQHLYCKKRKIKFNSSSSSIVAATCKICNYTQFLTVHSIDATPLSS